MEILLSMLMNVLWIWPYIGVASTEPKAYRVGPLEETHLDPMAMS